MKKAIAIASTLMLSMAMSNSVLADSDDNEREIRVNEVPIEVLNAARNKLQGFQATKAEVEQEGQYQEYELEGTANQKRYEVEVKVSSTGEIIEVEVEAEDD